MKIRLSENANTDLLRRGKNNEKACCPDVCKKFLNAYHLLEQKNYCFLEDTLMFMFANIVTAISDNTIGTKIVDKKKFLDFLTEAVKTVDFEKQRTPGQGLVPMPTDAFSTVSCGVGQRTKNPQDYNVRFYRGEVTLFLKREHAADVKDLRVVVYTRDAYLKDPDTLADPAEMQRTQESDAEYVIVAVLASADVKSELGFARFCKNLAGSNNDFALDALAPKDASVDDIRSRVQELKDQAGKIAAYASEWSTVAD